MATYAVPVLPSLSASRIRPRTIMVASADRSFRQRLQSVLGGLRWQVAEAGTGAQAWAEAERQVPEVMVIDGWLPDLDLGEFLSDFRCRFPAVDIVTAEPTEADQQSPRSPHHQEVLYALRSSEDSGQAAAPLAGGTVACDTAAWNSARVLPRAMRAEVRKPPVSVRPFGHEDLRREIAVPCCAAPAIIDVPAMRAGIAGREGTATREGIGARAGIVTREGNVVDRLPSLIGTAACMLDISRRVRLVAPRQTPVLIEGPTGSGKELVAKCLHRLSSRSHKPFVVLNCAAIPEALLEAELFGHTRGAFTGAVQGRMGRVEAADGGTLFLDEIGEMPLALQAKLLRFVECGELQRVGDNETLKVDVRIIAATHRQLAKRTSEGTFRADLYYRLAVFLIRTPALADHMEDLGGLVAHFLEKMGRTEPVKGIDAAALIVLSEHGWPGNVRELEHVLERAAILSGGASSIDAVDIDFGGVEE